MVRVRSHISLQGSRGGVGGSGLTLHSRGVQGSGGGQDDGALGATDKQYTDFKQYIITNFLIPIMNRKYTEVTQNYYNFDYIIDRLNLFKNNRNKTDVEFIIQVMNILRYSTDIHMSFEEATRLLYGSEKQNRLLVETSRIVLKSQYEIYNLLFGIPNKHNPTHMTYEIHMLNDIKAILDTYPGILFKDIYDRLKDKYGSRYIN